MLDIYKLAVEMSDRVSARRISANAFFVTVQSAIVAALGFLTASKTPPPEMLLLALCAVGILSALVWLLLLLRYRDLNTAKFVVIHKIEESLPLQVFTDEWAHLKGTSGNPAQKRYAELGGVERAVPWIFAAINAILAAYIVILWVR